MPPAGLAILIGAGPTSGAGIARVLADPSRGNLAVALLARNPSNLSSLTDSLRTSSHGGILHAFPTDTNPSNLRQTFSAIAAHEAFPGLKLKLAIYHVKNSHKTPFLEETPEAFAEAQQVYTTGAFAFSQEGLKMMYAHHGGQTLLADTGGQKKGTIIFTGTLGAMRTSAGYAAYGASRAGARMVAQAVAKEHSKFGVHCVHAIANGGITDEKGSEAVMTGKKMSAEAVGETYLWLSGQGSSLWTHELDLRPAQETF
jgi:NAD(P)-dependent dehydrogenase (short-subunit alcohol dehydrogenase family)